MTDSEKRFIIKIQVMSKPDDRMYSAEKPYMRKVRAPKGRVPGNSRWRRLQGKCNREIPRTREQRTEIREQRTRKKRKRRTEFVNTVKQTQMLDCT